MFALEFGSILRTALLLQAASCQKDTQLLSPTGSCVKKYESVYIAVGT